MQLIRHGQVQNKDFVLTVTDFTALYNHTAGMPQYNLMG
jgi:hypothetical protein